MSASKAGPSKAGTGHAPVDDIPQHSSIGSYGLAIARALTASGIDSERIFRAAGIDIALSNDPMVRLPAETTARLYRACVDVTNNPYFGLLVARYIHISHLHALGYAIAASSTLFDACRRIARYMRLVSQVAETGMWEEEGRVYLRFRQLVEVCGETEDCFYSFIVLTMRQLQKPGFKPLRVEFKHAALREGSEPYDALFGAPVLFGQPDGLLVFDKAELMLPLDGSCPELAQVNDNIIISYLARLDRHDVITGVTQKIIELLPDGECSRDTVASALCMSPTTLQLKLSQRGTSFQQLLDDTRRELASNYLLQATRSVTEITFMLGFTDTSNFTRAFKRWTGLSPTEFRARGQ